MLPSAVTRAFTCVDAFDEESQDIEWRINPGTGTPYPAGERIHKMMFLSSRIGGRHMWRGDKNFRTFLFVSNELGDALNAAKMTGIDLKPIKQA